MERLTEKTVGCFEYALKDHKAVPGEFGTYDAFFDYSMAVKRLGHYEDTVLEPEEIKVHEAVKYNAGYYHGDEDRCRWIEKELGPIDHLRDLLQAEQDGRLVVLPCKVGDTIYYTREGCPIVEHLKVRTFFVGDPTRRGKILHLHMIRTDKFDVSMDALGQTVFLTREEAEEALEGGTHEADTV